MVKKNLFPNIKEMKYPNLQKLAENEFLSSDKRGEYLEEEEEIYEDKENMSYNDETNIYTYFVDMPKLQHDNLGYTEYLHAAYDISSVKKKQEKCFDTNINLSDFVPEPKSLNQVIRLNGLINEKWGDVIGKEINGLSDNGTFLILEMRLSTDEVIPVKLAFMTEINTHGGLDKLKARICLIGDI